MVQIDGNAKNGKIVVLTGAAEIMQPFLEIGSVGWNLLKLSGCVKLLTRQSFPLTLENIPLFPGDTFLLFMVGSILGNFPALISQSTVVTCVTRRQSFLIVDVNCCLICDFLERKSFPKISNSCGFCLSKYLSGRIIHFEKKNPVTQCRGWYSP